MRRINKYILEKLHLNKDIHMYTQDITRYICDYYSLTDDEVVDIINDWFIKNDVSLIDIYNLNDSNWKDYSRKNSAKIDKLDKQRNSAINKFNDLSFSKFYDYFKEYFSTDDKKQDEMTVYLKNNNSQILETPDGKTICLLFPNCSVILRKKETI